VAAANATLRGEGLVDRVRVVVYARIQVRIEEHVRDSILRQLYLRVQVLSERWRRQRGRKRWRVRRGRQQCLRLVRGKERRLSRRHVLEGQLARVGLRRVAMRQVLRLATARGHRRQLLLVSCSRRTRMQTSEVRLYFDLWLTRLAVVWHRVLIGGHLLLMRAQGARRFLLKRHCVEPNLLGHLVLVILVTRLKFRDFAEAKLSIVLHLLQSLLKMSVFSCVFVEFDGFLVVEVLDLVVLLDLEAQFLA